MKKSRKDTALLLPDTNVFVAAIKDPRRETETIRLIMAMIDREDIRLVGDDFLVEEMVRYAEEFQSETASWILGALLGKMEIMEVNEKFVRICRDYIDTPNLSDIVHAAACLKSDAVLVTNDTHYDRIRDEGIIEVWSISMAIKTLL